MAELPHVELIPHREADLSIEGRPDYSVYARERRIGRIYCQSARRDVQQWFWSVQGVFTSMEVGHLHGLAASFDDAKERLSAAFDLWLAWALAAPSSHLSYARIQRDLSEVGALP